MTTVKKMYDRLADSFFGTNVGVFGASSLEDTETLDRQIKDCIYSPSDSLETISRRKLFESKHCAEKHTHERNLEVIILASKEVQINFPITVFMKLK